MCQTESISGALNYSALGEREREREREMEGRRREGGRKGGREGGRAICYMLKYM